MKPSATTASIAPMELPWHITTNPHDEQDRDCYIVDGSIDACLMARVEPTLYDDPAADATSHADAETLRENAMRAATVAARNRAEYIVTACNSYQAMRDALYHIMADIEMGHPDISLPLPAQARIRAALASLPA